MVATTARSGAQSRRQLARVVLWVVVAVVFLAAVVVTVRRFGGGASTADVVASEGTSAVAYATLPTEPLDVTVEVINRGSDVVRFTSASLVPLKGHQVGQLQHVGVYADRNVTVLSVDWPPRIPATTGSGPFADDRYVVSDLDGYVLAPGYDVMLVYAMTGGGQSGTFVAGGVKLHYTYKGASGQSTAWGIGVDCVGSKQGGKCAPGLSDSLIDQVDAIRDR